MRITVFTPTYNRAYTLTRLYESLKKQTFKDFEWIIVDDGSVDETKMLVEKFINSNAEFPIIYKKTENGGKHRAINRGMQLVSGELLLFMDSDDWLREDALECIDKVEKSIPSSQKEKYGGVQGLCVHTDGYLVGKTFSGNGYVDATALECGKYNIYGDKAEVYYTKIIKKYPFPEIEGENFLTERLVWDKIANDGYLIRYFNEGIYFCEYLDDGLSRSGNICYAQNPKQWAMAIYQDYAYGRTNFYSTTIQIYIYYLYEKNYISCVEMYENLNLTPLYFYFSISIQKIIDIIRYIVRGKITVKRTAEAEMKNRRW